MEKRKKNVKNASARWSHPETQTDAQIKNDHFSVVPRTLANNKVRLVRWRCPEGLFLGQY
jgi:hypothetical protein